MSNITSALANSYYQLSSGGSNNTNVPQAPSLSNALVQSTQSSSATASSAYLLDLSPAAQQYLSSVNGGASTGSSTAPNLASMLSGVGGNSSGASLVDPTKPNSGFVLTDAQKQAITAILTKYKDAPQTQDTYNKIQNDLNAAGLGASQLSQMDQVKNFNATELLINDLNGNFTNAATQDGTTTADEQTKSTNYMQQIITQWKSISTQGSSTQASDAVAATAGTGGA